jgi:hypothetical protein
MNSLPFELMLNILDLAVQESGNTYRNDSKTLSKLSTISTRWQSAVESITFRNILLKTSDWQQFTDFFAKYNRRQNLNKLAISISREEMEGGRLFWPNYEQCDSNSLNVYWGNVASMVECIWNELSSWGNNLRVWMLRVDFPQHPCLYRDSPLSTLQAGIPYNDLSKYGHVLSELKSVTKLVLAAKRARLCHSYLWKLACTCPSVKACKFTTDEHERRNQLAVMDTRTGMRLLSYPKHHLTITDLVSVISQTPRSLQEADLYFDFVLNMNQRIKPLQVDRAGVDIFSQCLRTLSLNLTRLYISASHISAELFWPQNDDSNSLQPRWPHLRDFELDTTIESAHGYYMLLPVTENLPHRPIYNTLIIPSHTLRDYLGRSQYVDSRSPQFLMRIRPDEKLFNGLAMSIARAMKQMPKVERLLYRANQFLMAQYIVPSYFSFSFYAANMERDLNMVDWVFSCHEAQLSGWHMPDEVVSIWKSKCGEQLQIGTITNNTIEYPRRGWLRRTEDGKEEERRNLADLFPLHQNDWTVNY